MAAVSAPGLQAIRPLLQQDRESPYGDAVAAGAAGAGVPNWTAGARSAPGGGLKYGLSAKPSVRATRFVGKLRTAML